MRKRIAGLVVMGVLALSPARARAGTVYSDLVCTATALEVCVNFDLTSLGGNSYQLVITYTSTNAASGQEGALRAAGIYDLTGGVTFSGVSVLNTTTGQSWGAGCGSLGNPTYSWACASAASASTDMLSVGNSVTIQFTSSAALTSANFTSGNLGFRGMVQSLGPNACSVKPDSRAPGNVVGGTDKVNADCMAVTPEPVSMVLFGSGLLGIGGVGVLRRRRSPKSTTA